MTGTAAVETRAQSLFRDLVTLTKPRIISLLLVTTIAPMLCTVSSVSRPATEVSGVMVATAAPLFRNISAIRIDASRS